MRKSLPSYEHIKDKYKYGQELSPLEIGRGIVFLLIEELTDVDLGKEHLADSTIFDSGEFHIAMLQSLTELAKQHLDVFEMVYYTTVMTCCIRCLVHEKNYYTEILSRNLDAWAYAKQQLAQLDFIDKSIAETSDKILKKSLKKIKTNFTKNMPKVKKEMEYKNISIDILSHLSAIYKFAEIISINWELPELTRLFYSSTKKSSYDAWVKSGVNKVNKYTLIEPKLKISDMAINADNAKRVSQLIDGRFLDISRTYSFLTALKDGIGLTISGSLQNE